MLDPDPSFLFVWAHPPLPPPPTLASPSAGPGEWRGLPWESCCQLWAAGSSGRIRVFITLGKACSLGVRRPSLCPGPAIPILRNLG